MLMMMKKRIREEEEQQQQQNNSITKCLMLLQSHNQFMMTKPINLTNPTNPINSNGLSGGHVFECKTCNKRFSSFQALGGHRASHKKPKLVTNEVFEEENQYDQQKTIGRKHECSICGVVFSMGQALGGHMRRHRASINDNGSDGFSSLLIKAATAKEQEEEEEEKNSTPPLMVLKRSNSIRIKADSCLLDLNLTPLENDLKILFGNMAPLNSNFIF